MKNARIIIGKALKVNWVITGVVVVYFALVSLVVSVIQGYL